MFSGNSPGMPYLTKVMSKFLNMGFSLEEVVTMATANPATIINRMPKHGTLQVGAPADVTLLEVVKDRSSSSIRETTSARERCSSSRPTP